MHTMLFFLFPCFLLSNDRRHRGGANGSGGTAGASEGGRGIINSGDGGVNGGNGSTKEAEAIDVHGDALILKAPPKMTSFFDPSLYVPHIHDPRKSSMKRFILSDTVVGAGVLMHRAQSTSRSRIVT
ncbi:hypothetical protein U1Q18_010369 [Sarracenia purpurea var. burkii]